MGERPGGRLPQGMVLKEYLSAFIRALHRERVFYLILAVAGLIFLGALGFSLAESGHESWWWRFCQGAWWAVVTLTTVGYGDVVPLTPSGRLVGVVLMLGGVVSVSLLTATVASIFVERKFRRERGLEAIKETQHILVLGWHHDGETLLNQLLKRLPETTPVVLVNKLPPEQMDALRERFSSQAVSFLWGDYSREETLQKANVRQAVKAIILAERQLEETSAQVDQRTLLTALTIKDLHPKIRVLAELLLPENRAYLERAGVEEILIRGQYDGQLMAEAVASPGLFRALTSLLIGENQSLWVVGVPQRFEGRPVKDLAAHLQKYHQALLIALYSEGRALQLDDLLSEEPSDIDEFIRRKFAETKMTHLFGRTKVECQINPPPELILGLHHSLVVIAREKPNI